MTSDVLGSFESEVLCDGGTFNIIYEFSDVCGTVSTACPVTVLPAAGPSIACPVIEAVDFCDALEFEAPLATGITSCGMTSDDVPGFLVDGATQNLTCEGAEISVIYSFSDVCGTASIACAVTVLPGDAPTIVCPIIEPVAYCDLEDFIAPFATAVEGCGATAFIPGLSTQDLTCVGGSFDLTYNFTDDCGTATVACSVTVLAGAAPVIICPEIEEIEFCDQDEFEAPLAQVILSCGGLTNVEGELDSIVSCNGTAVDVIYSFGDACGFTEVACSASVIPIEEGPEIIACPSSFEVISIPFIGGNTGSGTGSGTAPVPQAVCESIAVSWEEPFAEADCGLVSLEANIEPGSIFEGGVTTVIYTATDICGNTSECLFDVAVTCDDSFTEGDDIVAARSNEEITTSLSYEAIEEEVVETEIVSVNELETKVYPNPVSSVLNIEVRTEERLPMEFEIYDFLGAKITSTNTRDLEEGVNKIEIPVSDIQPGAYILIMRLGDEIRSERISIFR